MLVTNTASSGVYGSRRVCGYLREAGEACSKHRVAKIMKSHRIKAIRRYKVPRRIAGRPSIIALHSRKVVGWSMKPTMARGLVIDALMMALWRRKKCKYKNT